MKKILQNFINQMKTTSDPNDRRLEELVKETLVHLCDGIMTWEGLIDLLSSEDFMNHLLGKIDGNSCLYPLKTIGSLF